MIPQQTARGANPPIDQDTKVLNDGLVAYTVEVMVWRAPRPRLGAFCLSCLSCFLALLSEFCTYPRRLAVVIHTHRTWFHGVLRQCRLPSFDGCRLITGTESLNTALTET
jgi:hypothetical protein